MIGVLIGDHQAIFRLGLAQLLQAAGGFHVVAEAATGEELLERVASRRPDVVVLDIDLSGRGAITVIGELKRRRPEIRVLVLTRHPEEAFAVRCMQAGADGYLTKNAPPERLVTALHKIAAGGKFVSPSLAERLAQGLDLDAGRAPHERLSDREFQVLRFIGAGRTVGEIAVLLGLSAKTVSTYRARVLQKMGMKNTSEIMRYVIAASLEIP